MAYDGPFDDERTCYYCGAYIKKVLTTCPECCKYVGKVGSTTGMFSTFNISRWLLFVGVMLGIFVPLLLLVILAASHHGGCLSC